MGGRRFVLLTLVVVACAPPLLAQGLPLTMAKSFTPSTVPVGGTATTTMTVTITNPNGASVTGISFSDTYPAGLVPDSVGAYTCSAGNATFNGSGWPLSHAQCVRSRRTDPLRLDADRPRHHHRRHGRDSDQGMKGLRWSGRRGSNPRP